MGDAAACGHGDLTLHLEDSLTIRLGACCLVTLAVLAPVAGWGQMTPGDAPKPKPNKYGSPLDTFRNTHLWTDVPPAQDFVTATRPDVKSLRYTPLTGVDPVRPKARDPANVKALQAEMERFGVENEAKARGLRGPTSARKPREGAAAAHAP